MKNRSGIGGFVVISAFILFFLLSKTVSNITFFSSIMFFGLTFLITFALLNIISESRSGQYDPLRDLWFIGIAIAFLIISLITMKTYLNATIGILVGLINGIVTFILRPKEMKHKIMQISSEVIDNVRNEKEAQICQIDVTSVVLDKEKLLSRFKRHTYFNLIQPKKVLKAELVYKPYYLIKSKVKAEKGIAVRKKMKKDQWDIDVIVDAKTGGKFGLDDDLASQTVVVKKGNVDFPIIKKEEIIEKISKFIRYSIGPSKYRTIPEIIRTNIKTIYRPYWLVFFDNEDYSLIPADKLEIIMRR